MTMFLILNTVLQVAMVTGGHYSAAILGLSAALGVGIPLVLGIAYGAMERPGYGGGSKEAFIFSFVGAAIGVTVAILLGDQPWALLTFAPASSGVTGVLGALIGVKVAGGPAEGIA